MGNLFIPEPYEHPEPTEYEKLEWWKRVDESIDNIAHHLRLPRIPYSSMDEGAEFYARYLAAHRLELLETSIRENVV